jgi:8-amino-7-oxononanoate synthase
MAFEHIAAQLQQQTELALYRQRFCLEKISEQNILVDGKAYINFSSNDYLGLNQHPELLAAFQQGIDTYGLCATGSNLITGYHKAHQLLEENICQWLNKESCLLFTSGFSANSGVLQALATSDSQFFLDKLSHASLIDGALTSSAQTRRFLHNDLKQLEQLLAKSNSQNKLIVSEGVFSMDGDQAPVHDLINLAQKYQSWLYLDDAHSIGVVGEQGQGSASYCGSKDIDIVMATFGKAVATSGAFIACSAELKEYLLNFCRHYIYTTAMSPALAMATNASIELIKKDHWRREKIQQLSALFIELLDCNLEVLPTQSSIHALVIGDENKTLKIAKKMKEQGYWLTAIRPPTVPRNSSRLRVTICANHNDNDIKGLALALNKVLN